MEVEGIEPSSIITTPRRLPTYPVYSMALYARDGHLRHPPPKGPAVVLVPSSHAALRYPRSEKRGKTRGVSRPVKVGVYAKTSSRLNAFSMMAFADASNLLAFVVWS